MLILFRSRAYLAICHFCVHSLHTCPVTNNVLNIFSFSCSGKGVFCNGEYLPNIKNISDFISTHETINPAEQQKIIVFGALWSLFRGVGARTSKTIASHMVYFSTKNVTVDDAIQSMYRPLGKIRDVMDLNGIPFIKTLMTCDDYRLVIKSYELQVSVMTAGLNFTTGLYEESFFKILTESGRRLVQRKVKNDISFRHATSESPEQHMMNLGISFSNDEISMIQFIFKVLNTTYYIEDVAYKVVDTFACRQDGSDIYVPLPKRSLMRVFSCGDRCMSNLDSLASWMSEISGENVLRSDITVAIKYFVLLAGLVECDRVFPTSWIHQLHNFMNEEVLELEEVLDIWVNCPRTKHELGGWNGFKLYILESLGT